MEHFPRRQCMYKATGGGELTRVLFLCGRSVVQAGARCGARPRQAERACAFEKLNPNPTITLVGFPFQFGIFQMCVTFYWRCHLTSNMGIWENTACAPSCSRIILWAGTLSRQDTGWRTLPEPKHQREWLLEREGTKITVRRNNIHKGRKQGERRTIISRHPI